MSYLEILRKLIKFGDKLPEVIEIIQRISPDFLRLIEIGKEAFGRGLPFTQSAPEPGDLLEIADLEESFATSMSQGTFAANGERIKAILQFIAEHPQLIATILALL
jgi:hypothetical protein